MKTSAVKQCQPAGYRQLQAVNIFRIYYKLFTALTEIQRDVPNRQIKIWQTTANIQPGKESDPDNGR